MCIYIHMYTYVYTYIYICLMKELFDSEILLNKNK